jgi:hypothetical protein
MPGRETTPVADIELMVGFDTGMSADEACRQGVET